MSALRWHRPTRRLVLVDRRGQAWRLRGAGKVHAREPSPLFEITPNDDGTFTLGFSRLARRLAAEPVDDDPTGDGWIELSYAAVLRVVFGQKHAQRSTALGMIARAGSAAAAVARAGASVQAALERLESVLHAGSRIVRR